MGMAGTAVAYVYDPSALFHNPAGLANVKRASVIANASPLIGKIEANPLTTGDARESETTFAPFFLVGGAYRFHKYVTAGLAVYPVASAGAEYKYELFNTPQENRTTLLFVEASPGIAVNLPGNVNLGASYRVTYVSLERFQGNPDAPAGTKPTLDFDMTGINWLGFRLGLQWHEEFGDHRVKLGAHYRHKTVTEITNDKGIATTEFKDISTKFTLPSRFSFGSRYDYMDFGIAFDVEYALNSQNKGDPIRGTYIAGPNEGERAAVNNVFRWSNAFTLRQGLEYRLVDGHLPIRAGYIWDQKTTNPKFPSAFGTPPGPAHIGTIGTGWNAGAWQVNGAYAYRTASGKVTNPDTTTCAFCGGPGDYKLTMHGVYVDFSYEWQ